jgi:O-antigen ligase
MADFLDFLRRTNVGALIALSAIYLGLLSQGANNAALAALLGCAMLVLLAAAALVAGQSDLSRVLSETSIQTLAAIAFIAYALATAIPGLPVLLGQGWAAHPLAREMLGDAASVSLSPYRTLEGIAAFLGPASAFLIGALCTPDRETRDWAGRWIVVLSIPYSLMGVAMYFNTQTDVTARLDIGLGSANAAATVLGMIVLVSAALIMRAGSGRFDGGEAAAALPKGWRWARYLVSAPFSLTALILAFACLMLTASRGGLVALAVAIVTFGVCIVLGEARSTRKRRGSIIIPFLAVIGIAAFLFHRGGDFVMQRFAAAAESAENRHSLLAVHWGAFLERPLFGHGLNTFHEVNSIAGSPDNWAVIGKAGSAHNIFVQLLEETGLIGAALFALMLAPPILQAMSRLARGASGVEWSACAIAVCAFCLVHGMVDFGLQVPAIAALFAFMLGALVGESDRKHEPPGGGAFRFKPSTE